MTSAGDFFRYREIEVSELGAHADTFAQIRSGSLQGALVHGVYSAAECAATIGRIQSHQPPLLQTWFPEPFHSCFFGQNLNLSPPELGAYFAAAAVFNPQLDQVLPPGRGFAPHLAQVLAALDQGRPFQAAPGEVDGQHYMATTIRRHDEGGYIPAHVDNEFMLRPSYRHLTAVAQPHIQSFVLALSLADAGGALEIYDWQAPALGTQLISDDGQRRSKPDLDSLDKISFRIPPGTMAIFDSGRYLHRVSPVQGPNRRWTLCSFMSLSRTGDAMYCWG